MFVIKKIEVPRGNDTTFFPQVMPTDNHHWKGRDAYNSVQDTPKHQILSTKKIYYPGGARRIRGDCKDRNSSKLAREGASGGYCKDRKSSKLAREGKRAKLVCRVCHGPACVCRAQTARPLQSY